MKAIRIYEFGDPEVMRIEDVEDPKAGHGQLVVRVYAAGVNPVDAYIRSGLYAFKPELPYTPGMDAAGIVEAVGVGVRLFKMGDRVYISGSVSGSYAEKALCNESQVHRLTERVSFAEGHARTRWCVVNSPAGAWKAFLHGARDLGPSDASSADALVDLRSDQRPTTYVKDRISSRFFRADTNA